MKKVIVSILLVAAVLAANLSAQTVVSEGSQKTAKTVSAPSSGSGFDGLTVNTWYDQWIKAKVLTLSDNELANASDSDKDNQVEGVFEGSAGAKALIGDVFYTKGQFFYGIGKNGVEYATGILGVGAQIGKFAIGINGGIPMMTLRGINLGADVSLELAQNWYLYGWGNFLINTNQYKNDIISVDGIWTKGAKEYSAYDFGIGTEYTSAGGLYLSGQAGASTSNNEYIVAGSANKVLIATNVLGKVGVVAGNGSIFYTGIGLVSGEGISAGKTNNKVQVIFGFKKN